MIRIILSGALAAATLAGCQSVCDGTKEECGTGAGGLAGLGLAYVASEVIGDETVSALVGVGLVLTGAYLGQQYGKYLDEQDAAKAQDAAIEALNSREGYAEWESDTNEGVRGEIKIAETTNEAECRMAEHLIVNDTGQHQLQTKFCRDDNGKWKAMEVA